MLERELDASRNLALEAGRILMQIYETDFSVQYKGATDPVTEADRLANDFLVAALRKRFPDDGVVAEESPDISDALRHGRCWYVDPLDGTKEFVARNGEFAVMLGLAIEGRAALGVVYQPVTDKLYSGVVGSGAQLRAGAQTRALRVSSQADPAKLRLVVSRSHRSSDIDKVAQRLGIAEERRSGSVGLKVGLIAEREADLYVHTSDKSSAWDACGPEAVVRAADGRFSDLNGDDFVYGGHDLRTARGILACNASGV